MSLATSASQVREALEKSGSSWIFGYWGEHLDKHIDTLAFKIEEFTAEYQRRFGETPDPFYLLEVNPTKGAAFFHITSLTVSLPMRIMIWRILHGCTIEKVDFKYQYAKDALLTVTLRMPNSQSDESYVGEDPYDFRVLRSLGTAGLNNHLVLDGYYAPRN